MSGQVGALGAYVGWMRGRALPFWAEAGRAADTGRFHERLDAAGRPIALPHRAMVQARQIAVFAQAALLGWYPGGEAAERALALLLRDFCEEGAEQASFAFSIDGRGGIASPVRDAYAHAFILFALAWMVRLTGAAHLLTLADKVIAFIEAHLVDRALDGLFDAWPITDRTKRQNPVMHLLEAYLALEEAAPGRGYLGCATALVGLFEQRLYRAADGILPEYFAEDWGAPADPALRDFWEPGHHFEWAWLLGEQDRLAGTNHAAAADRLYAVARDHGIAADGTIYDALLPDRTVLRRSTRLWPHTEAIKAAIVRHDPPSRALAERMAAVLLDRFVDRPFAGGWTDQFAADGSALVDYVPASSLYHLFVAAAEAARADDAVAAVSAPLS